MRLLLFDIDGTLLRVTGGGRRAVADAISTVTNRTACMDGVSFSGRTDPDIFRTLLRKNGVSQPDEWIDEAIQHYVDAALETIQPRNVEPLPGVHSLLSRLAQRSDVFLGLVTGNVEAIAYHKLRSAGLAEHFSVGAFGSDHENRNKLPAIATRRASVEAGRSFSLSQVVIIGDTRHDIHCAQAAGARVAAVCTGRTARSDLHSHTPDLLLESLNDTDDIEQQILAI